MDPARYGGNLDRRLHPEYAAASPRRLGGVFNQKSRDGNMPSKKPDLSEEATYGLEGLRSADIALNNVLIALDTSWATPAQSSLSDPAVFSRKSLQSAEGALNNALMALTNPCSPSTQPYPVDTVSLSREGLQSIDIALNNVRMALASPRALFQQKQNQGLGLGTNDRSAATHTGFKQVSTSGSIVTTKSKGL